MRFRIGGDCVGSRRGGYGRSTQEGLGDIYVSPEKVQRFNAKKKRAETALKKITHAAVPKHRGSQKVFIWIATISGEYDYRVSKREAPRLPPCATFLEEIIYEAKSKRIEMMVEAMNIAEQRVKELKIAKQRAKELKE